MSCRGNSVASWLPPFCPHIWTAWWSRQARERRTRVTMNPDGEIDIPSEQPTMRIFQARKPYPNSTYPLVI